MLPKICVSFHINWIYLNIKDSPWCEGLQDMMMQDVSFLNCLLGIALFQSMRRKKIHMKWINKDNHARSSWRHLKLIHWIIFVSSCINKTKDEFLFFSSLLTAILYGTCIYINLIISIIMYMRHSNIHSDFFFLVFIWVCLRNSLT